MKLNNLDSRRAFLAELTTSELDQLLQAELQKEYADGDLVRVILEILEGREPDVPIEMNSEIAKASQKLEDSMRTQKASGRQKYPVFLKVASILLVVGILVFAVPQAAQAERIFALLARWMESVFEFFSPGEVIEQPEYVFETDHPGLQQIYDAVVELGVTEPVVPMWVPEGYELVECKIINIPNEKSVCAVLKFDEKIIAYRVSIIGNKSGTEYYKDGIDAIEYEYGEVIHYIVKNIDRQVVTWSVDTLVCTVAVDCQEDALFEILKSIYTTEVI